MKSIKITTPKGVELNVSLPESWYEITLQQYIDLQEDILDATLDDIEITSFTYLVTLLSSISKIDKEILVDFDRTYLENELMTLISFTYTSKPNFTDLVEKHGIDFKNPEHDKIVPTFEFENEIYGVYGFSSERAGEQPAVCWIDAEEADKAGRSYEKLAKSKSDERYKEEKKKDKNFKYDKNYHYLNELNRVELLKYNIEKLNIIAKKCAIVSRPLGTNYSSKEMKKRAEKFKNLPVATALSLRDFFFQSANEKGINGLEFIENLNTLILSMQHVENLTNTGIGSEK